MLLNPQAMHSEPIAEPAPKLVQRPPPPRPGRLRAEGFYEGYMLLRGFYTGVYED